MKFRAWLLREYQDSHYFSLLLGILWLVIGAQDFLREKYFFAAWQTFFAGWMGAWWLALRGRYRDYREMSAIVRGQAEWTSRIIRVVAGIAEKQRSDSRG